MISEMEPNGIDAHPSALGHVTLGEERRRSLGTVSHVRTRTTWVTVAYTKRDVRAELYPLLALRVSKQAAPDSGASMRVWPVTFGGLIAKNLEEGPYE
jgi:hypothetical protein